MGLTIEVVDREPEISLAIRSDITLWHIQSTIKRAYARITACAEAQSVVFTGSPYVRYFKFDWHELRDEGRLEAFIKSFFRKWHLEIGIPVGSAARPTDDIYSAEIPGGRFVQAMHVGNYKTIGDTYSTMLEWIRKERLSVKSESMEIYLDDPVKIEQAELRTLVLVPLQEEAPLQKT